MPRSLPETVQNFECYTNTYYVLDRLPYGSDLLPYDSHTHGTSIHTCSLLGHSSLSGVSPAPPHHPSLTRARATFGSLSCVHDLRSRLHSHRTGRGTRDAAGGTRRTHARKHTSSRGHTQERKHAIIVSHSLSRHAGHAPLAREPLTRRAAVHVLVPVLLGKYNPGPTKYRSGDRIACSLVHVRFLTGFLAVVSDHLFAPACLRSVLVGRALDLSVFPLGICADLSTDNTLISVSTSSLMCTVRQRATD